MNEEMISIDQSPLPSRVRITPTSLTVPADYTYEEATTDGKKLAIHHEASNWWIGDWLNACEARWGETYAQAAGETGISPERLRQLKFVSSRIPKPIRNSYLHWSHHRVVAVAELADEDRAVWLAKAIKNEWTSHELEKQIRGLPEPRSAYENGKTVVEVGIPANAEGTAFLSNARMVRGRPAIETVDPVKIELCAICGHSGGVVRVCQTCIDNKPVTMPTKARELLRWAMQYVQMPKVTLERDYDKTQEFVDIWNRMFAALKRAAESKRGRPKKDSQNPR